MKPFIVLAFALVLSVTIPIAVFGTSISNVPELSQRELVVRPGGTHSFVLAVGGAEKIDVAVLVPPELAGTVTLYDPAPRQGPRTIRLEFDFDNGKVPPGAYSLQLAANEIPSSTAQVATSVSVSVGFVIRSYSEDPYLEIISSVTPPVQQGSAGTFQVDVISRTLVDIPFAQAKVDVIDEAGSVLVSGTGRSGVIKSGERVAIIGDVDTRSLLGGIYKVNTTVTYSGKSATYEKTVLRVGNLTIDLGEYTKTFLFNQTNKFQFQLISNWNKPLTRVGTTVRLLGQQKRSAQQTIEPFSPAEMAEVYFDRSEQPPGTIAGSMEVTYQELAPSILEQDDVTTHTFTIPFTVDIVLPPEELVAKQPFSFKPVHLLIGAGILLLIINVIVVVLLLRKKEPKQEQTTQKPKDSNPDPNAQKEPPAQK